MNVKEIMRKTGAFACTCAAIVGAVGGTIVSGIYANWFIGLCVAGTAAMAVPFVLKLWKR